MKPPISSLLVNHDAGRAPLTDAQLDELLQPLRERLRHLPLTAGQELIVKFRYGRDAATWPDHYVSALEMRTEILTERVLVKLA